MQAILPPNWQRPRGFSNGIAAEGRMLFVAGQIGKDPVSGTPAGGGFGGQVRQALSNVVAVVTAAGGSAADIAHMTWYVTDLDAYRAAGADIGAAYKDLLGRHFPSMTMIQVGGLLDADAQVEIEAFAVLPTGG